MISKTLKSAEEMLQKANQTFAGKKEGEEKGEGEGGEAGGDEKVCEQIFVWLHALWFKGDRLRGTISKFTAIEWDS